MGLWVGSGIRWTICKQSAPRSRQITTPTPHHSIFYRLDALPDAQLTVSKHWRQKWNVLATFFYFQYKLRLSLSCRFCSMVGTFKRCMTATFKQIFWCSQMKQLWLTMKKFLKYFFTVTVNARIYKQCSGSVFNRNNNIKQICIAPGNRKPSW